MFKKILKGRHDAPPAQKDTKPPLAGAGYPQRYAGHQSINPVQYPITGPSYPGLPEDQENVSITPVSYDKSTSGGFHPLPPSSQRPQGSYLPVDYRASGPGYPQARPVGSALPVEYNMSPPPNLAPPQVSNNPTSPMPVDYNIGSPVHHPGPGGNLQPQRSPGLPPQQALPPRQYYEYRAQQPSPTTPQQQWPTDPNTKYSYCPPPSPRAHEMPAVNSPAELPASAVPPRYEMPATHSVRRSPVPPYSTPHQAQNPGWTSPTNTATTFGSTTTLVPSPRSGPTSPLLGDAKTGWGAPAQGQIQGGGAAAANDGIKKYVVDIYCPLKRDADGNRREQIPRDVREFRLAKVALIPIIAGKRSFVSLDVVFGEVDKAFADLAEKHFSLCNRTQFMKHDPRAVVGGQVYSIGPLNIAYRDGDQSTVYVKFRSQEEKDRFKADYFEMWRYVEQTAS